MKNILITGGAGFIGSNFVHYLLEAEPEVQIVNLDALTYAGSLENLAGLPDAARHELVQGDIRNRQLVTSLLVDHHIDTIVHFAAESHVDRSISGPAPFIDTNVVGTFTLLDAARAVWETHPRPDDPSRRFLHVSTDEVYGSLEPDEPAFQETTPYHPNSPYAASKASADHLVRAYHHTYGLPILITNCSNNYGPRQFPEKLIPLMILSALEGKPLPLYGDGQQIRDWLYVIDHCRALRLVIERGAPGETYNIGGANQPTNLELVRSLCQILDELAPDSPHTPHAQLITYVKDRPGHDRRYAMAITKIGRELGWEPNEDLASGLYKTIRWYLEHQDWIDSVRAQPGFQDWLDSHYAERGRAR